MVEVVKGIGHNGLLVIRKVDIQIVVNARVERNHRSDCTGFMLLSVVLELH